MVAKPRLMIGDILAEELDALYDIESTSYSNPWPKDAFKRELKLPFSRILVARNNEPFGPILFGYLVLWIIRGEAHILNVAVHPEHRRQGVATARLQAGIDAARLQGAEIL